MLLLLFKISERHYGVDARRIVEVVPSTALQRSIDVSPQNRLTSQVGLLRWQVGNQIDLIPVVDLAQMLMNVESPRTMGTRIMVVEDEGRRLWGLMATGMVQTWAVENELWMNSDEQQVLMRGQTLVYGLSIDRVLTDVREQSDQFRVRTVAVERNNSAS